MMQGMVGLCSKTRFLAVLFCVYAAVAIPMAEDDDIFVRHQRCITIKAQINLYGFDLSVPIATTALEGTAIYARRQLMVTDLAAARKACSIIIHSVT